MYATVCAVYEPERLEGPLPAGPAPAPTGRRRRSRLRVRLPARVITLSETHNAILFDLSLLGAKARIGAPVRVGGDVVLEWNGHEAFGEVVWCQQGFCGIAFFEAISPDLLLATREYNETAQLPQDREIVRQTARQWVEGTTRL